MREAAVADDRVAVGQVLAEMDLVDHLLHVDRAAPGLGRVSGSIE